MSAPPSSAGRVSGGGASGFTATKLSPGVVAYLIHTECLKRSVTKASVVKVCVPVLALMAFRASMASDARPHAVVGPCFDARLHSVLFFFVIFCFALASLRAQLVRQHTHVLE
jgi:hypothetical protein